MLKIPIIKSEDSYDYLKRFGHTMCIIRDKIFVIGGYNPDQPKISTMICVDTKSFNFKMAWALPSNYKFLFSASAVIKVKCYIFGGRKSPTDPVSDFYEMDYEGNFSKINCANQPSPRWGHSMCSLDDNLYLIGGRTNDNVFNTIEKFDFGAKKWEECASLDHGLFSHSTVTYKSKIYISGGLKNATKCDTNAKLIIFDPKSKAVQYEKLTGLFPRFSHSSHMMENGKLILVGGISIAPSDIILTIIELNTYQVFNFEPSIAPSVPLVQHGSICDLDDNKVHIFGGGTNCFSFGMHCNDRIYSLDLNRS